VITNQLCNRLPFFEINRNRNRLFSAKTNRNRNRHEKSFSRFK